MNEMNMFERAVREKTRFNFRGSISVEDLWDLSLTNLDKIYGELESELEKLPKKSLLSNNSEQRDDIEFKQSIIAYIVTVKQSEIEDNAQKAEKAAKKQKLLAIIESKQNESYNNMSIEELTALVNNL